MTTSKETIDSATLFFDVCARIEATVAELYYYYGEIHQENDHVAQMWVKTAQEEEGHERQFQLAYKLRKEADFELTADLERARRLYQKLVNLLEHVRKNPPSVKVALEKAIEMEEALAGLHLDCSVRFKDDSINRMFQALRSFDQEHVAAMQRCLTVMNLKDSEMNG